MSDGQLAIVGVGSVGSMALWQASKLGIAPLGFEAVTPAHPRSAVGGDTRLFRMTYRGQNNLYPVLQLAERLWRQLEQESGQEILTQCGGLSIGETEGAYIPALLDSLRRTGAPHEVLPYAEMARRYPQHHLTPDECGILDRQAGFLRTDRAVLGAVDAARENGAQLIRNAPVREIREVAGGVQISTDTDRWTFDRVIVAAGYGSGTVLPPFLQRHVHTKRNLLTWFTAGEAQQFVPEAFPVFSRITRDRSLYGAPTVDKVTVKATLDGRPTRVADANTIARDLTPAEAGETIETVQTFLPGLIPEIVRSDAYPDLFTSDSTGLLGPLPGSDRIYYATGFSGTGFKVASALGAIAATEVLGRGPLVEDLDFLRPARFGSPD